MQIFTDNQCKVTLMVWNQISSVRLVEILKRINDVVPDLHLLYVPKQTHNVDKTWFQRRCDVKTSHRRWNDVAKSFCVYWCTTHFHWLKVWTMYLPRSIFQDARLPQVRLGELFESEIVINFLATSY